MLTSHIWNRFSGLTYYEKTTDDLFKAYLSTTSGHSGQTANVGSIINKGVEFEFDAQVVKQVIFFELYGNVSENKTKF